MIDHNPGEPADITSNTVAVTPGPPPGPPPEETAEIARRFLDNPLRCFEDMLQRYGRTFRLTLGPTDTVFLNDAATVEKVLRLDFESYGMSSRQEALNFPLLGRSMPVVSDHLYWEQLHAIMLPMFTPKMLRTYFETTVHCIQEEVEHLAGLNARGDAFSLLAFVRHGIFTALTRTLFARGVDATDVPVLLDLFARSNVYMNVRFLTGEGADVDQTPAIADGRDALRKLDQWIYALIANRRAQASVESEDMLDVFLTATKSDGNKLTDVEIRDNVMAFFFGGQETTPSVITWAFGLLASNPDKRARMLDEIDTVLRGLPPTFQDLAKLPYTEGVLDEALRLYPPFAFIGREALRDVVLDDYAIRKGTPLGFVGWTIHRDPAQWPDPEVFDPERHTNEKKAARAKCAFVAFGYGTRRCIGERVGRMEGLLMLSLISQRYLLDLASERLPQAQVQMAIKPADGMPVTAVSRTVHR
jgi:cytochrome P450